MVIIRLLRKGIKKYPCFSIIVTDSKKPRDSNFIEIIGFYNPFIDKKKKYFNISKNRLNFWIKLGAKLSFAVIRLIKKNKVNI